MRFFVPTRKRAAAPLGVVERDGEHFRLRLSAFPRQFHFSKDTIKEFIFVLQSESVNLADKSMKLRILINYIFL